MCVCVCVDHNHVYTHTHTHDALANTENVRKTPRRREMQTKQHETRWNEMKRNEAAQQHSNNNNTATTTTSDVRAQRTFAKCEIIKQKQRRTQTTATKATTAKLKC